jgi:hypothetical protein
MVLALFEVHHQMRMLGVVMGLGLVFSAAEAWIGRHQRSWPRSEAALVVGWFAFWGIWVNRNCPDPTSPSTFGVPVARWIPWMVIPPVLRLPWALARRAGWVGWRPLRTALAGAILGMAFTGVSLAARTAGHQDALLFLAFLSGWIGPIAVSFCLAPADRSSA